MDWKLELVAVPVSDVDRAKAFYTEKVGFNADHDHKVSDEIRFVQLTPPGSACSIAIGMGIVDTPPGSAQGLQLVVSDINAARTELLERGVEVSGVEEFPGDRSSSSAIRTATAGPCSSCRHVTKTAVRWVGYSSR
jgi:catechol 2,3-dioxygenase-like lactoylglutathione lyase family enzyme